MLIGHTRTDLTPRESEGPDRVRGSVRCREFHDLPNRDLGGTYNCCCCDPCRYLRPNDHLRLFADWGWCCRCVPRVLFVRFVPDDPNDPCCQPGGIPLFFNHDFAWTEPKYYGTYAGIIYGILVRVDLGTIDEADGLYETGTGTGIHACAWRIRAWDTRIPAYPKLLDTIIEIDHETTTCIDVPNTTLVTGITGPTRCTGSLILEDVPKARLPFVEREDTLLFNQHRDPRDDSDCRGDATGTGTGTGSYEYGRAPTDCQPEFINLCGECDPDYTTLTGLSVNGSLYLVDADINGAPSFINGNRLVFWNNTYWSLVEDASVTGTPGISDTEIATGPPLPNCPVGLWTWTTLGAGAGTGSGTSPDDRQCFCVTDPADSRTHKLCGCCGQVCSRLCVRKQWNSQDLSDIRNLTFTWFESWDDPTDTLIERGWSYHDPVTDTDEYIYLREDETEGCYLLPVINVKEGNAVEFDPIALLDRCSCGIYEIVVGPSDTTAIIRCGFCTCWDFYCGKCRCAPAELCVALYLAGVWYPDVSLLWDEDLKGWTGTGLEETGTTGTGTGTGSIDITVLLQRDDQGRCILVPVIPGHTFPEGYAYPVYTCGYEAVSRQADRVYLMDFISFYAEDYSDLNSILMMVGASLTPDCGRGNCTEATPCYEECGTHPSHLHATLTQHRVPGDLSIEGDLGETWSMDILLTYLQTVDYYTPSIPAETSAIKYSCWYQGYIPATGDCCPFEVTLRNGVIRFSAINPGGCTLAPDLGDLALTETCDPYYGDTGEIGPIQEIIPNSCSHLTVDQTTRSRVIITE